MEDCGRHGGAAMGVGAARESGVQPSNRVGEGYISGVVMPATGEVGGSGALCVMEPDTAPS